MNEESTKFEQEREYQLSQLKNRQNDKLKKFCADNNFMPPTLEQQISKASTSMLRSYYPEHQQSSDSNPSSFSSIASNLKSLNQFHPVNMSLKRLNEDRKNGNGSAMNLKSSYTNESLIASSLTAENSLVKEFTQL